MTQLHPKAQSHWVQQPRSQAVTGNSMPLRRIRPFRAASTLSFSGESLNHRYVFTTYRHAEPVVSRACGWRPSSSCATCSTRLRPHPPAQARLRPGQYSAGCTSAVSRFSPRAAIATHTLSHSKWRMRPSSDPLRSQRHHPTPSRCRICPHPADKPQGGAGRFARASACLPFPLALAASCQRCVRTDAARWLAHPP